MINLLSTESKKELKAARRNVVLRKYVFTTLFLVLVIAGSYAVGYGIMYSQESNYKRQIAEYAPQKATYSDTLKQATEYNKNLSIAKSILGNELSYSSFTTLLAQTMPKQVVLVGLNIATKDLAKPVEFFFGAKSYSDVLATKESLEKSPYFSEVQIRSTNKLPQGTYPYQFTVILTFDRAAFSKAHKEGSL
ncbi:MAG: hypothetical protein ABIQ64_04455 [Candidatus Saccharimonadales bacterium]